MTTGTVKFFNHTKGFGFITPADNSKDVFVHKNNINGRISDGDSVSYDVEVTHWQPEKLVSYEQFLVNIHKWS